MLVSTVQRSGVEFPVLYSRFLLVICFIHISVYMSVPISQITFFFYLTSHKISVVLQGQWCFKDKGRPCLKKCQRYTPAGLLIALPTRLHGYEIPEPTWAMPTWATGPVPNKERHLGCPTPTLKKEGICASTNQ